MTHSLDSDKKKTVVSYQFDYALHESIASSTSCDTDLTTIRPQTIAKRIARQKRKRK